MVEEPDRPRPPCRGADVNRSLVEQGVRPASASARTALDRLVGASPPATVHCGRRVAVPGGPAGTAVARTRRRAAGRHGGAQRGVPTTLTSSAPRDRVPAAPLSSTEPRGTPWSGEVLATDGQTARRRAVTPEATAGPSSGVRPGPTPAAGRLTARRGTPWARRGVPTARGAQAPSHAAVRSSGSGPGHARCGAGGSAPATQRPVGQSGPDRGGQQRSDGDRGLARSPARGSSCGQVGAAGRLLQRGDRGRGEVGARHRGR
jgi:hypothetical protein